MNEDRLKKVGLKITGPRLKILQLLSGAHDHLRAEDIYQQLLASGEDVVLATVYRVLSQFEAAGLVKRHRFAPDVSVFELDEGGHHDHLVCVRCSQIVEFVDDVIELQQEKIAKHYDFEITDHCLTIYGVCGICRAA